MGSSKTDSDAHAQKVRSVRQLFRKTMRGHGFVPADPFLIAFSGGLDSSVLLDLVTQYSDDPQNLVRVIHVHHGLNANADRWLLHCRDASRRLGLDFHGEHVDLDASGGNLEARARAQRYRVMLAHLRDHETLLLAHHRGDTVETFFLNLMRGAGARGLSGIPALVHRSGKRFFRPMQQLSKTEILDYATLSGLNWVEDESNADPRFDRNYLRHRVLPRLNERWPECDKMVARACQNLADTAALADETGGADLQAVAVEEHRPGSVHQLQLSREKLMRLTPLRRKNLLRYAFCQLAVYAPERRFLDKLLALVESGANNKRLSWEKWIVHAYDSQLFFYPAQGITPAANSIDWHLAAQPSVRWGGLLITADKAAQAELQIRPRRGGERLQLAGRAHSHALKALLQQWRVPPWERSALPLIWRGARLVAIPGYLQPADMAEAGDLADVRFHVQNVR